MYKSKRPKKITVEYEDGTTVSRNYNATAYSSELYMFIKEIK